MFSRRSQRPRSGGLHRDRVRPTGAIGLLPPQANQQPQSARSATPRRTMEKSIHTHPARYLPPFLPTSEPTQLAHRHVGISLPPTQKYPSYRVQAETPPRQPSRFYVGRSLIASPILDHPPTHTHRHDPLGHLPDASPVRRRCDRSLVPGAAVVCTPMRTKQARPVSGSKSRTTQCTA